MPIRVAYAIACGASWPPVPGATRPSRIAITVLARAVTEASWVEQTTQVPSLARVGEQLGDPDRVGLVEVGRRLVGDDQPRVGGERPGERDALALAAAEPAGRAAVQLAEADLPRGPRLACSLACLAFAPRALRPSATLSAALRPATSVETCGTIATCSARSLASPARSSVCEIGAREGDRAVVGAVEARDQVQQRRLPAAGRADQRVEGAGLERERDVGDGVDGLGLGAEAAADVLEADELLALAWVRCGSCTLQLRPAGPAQHDRARPDRDLGLVVDARRAQVVGVEPEQAAVVDEHVAAAVGAVQLAGQAAVADRHHPACHVGGPRVVGGEQDGRLLLGGALGQQLEDRAARRRVELARDLVHQQELGLDGDRDAERRALLLAAGELVAGRLLAPFEADAREQLARALPGLPARCPGQARAQRDPRPDALIVAERRARVLRDRGDRVRAVRGELLGLGLVQPRPVDEQLARGDRLQPGQAGEQRRLPAAARPHHRDQLPGVGLQRRALERHDVPGRRLVDHEQLAGIDRATHGVSPPRSP